MGAKVGAFGKILAQQSVLLLTGVNAHTRLITSILF
jgi:hypothetical protein